MHPTRWLEVAFGSESRVRILRLLVADPSKVRTEREIARTIGMSANAVNRSIRHLEQEGVLQVEKIGNARAVRLHSGAILLTTLRSVFAAEEKSWSAALKLIGRCIPPEAACYVFGSSMQGTAHTGSDVDILVVAQARETANEIAYRIQKTVHLEFPGRLQIITLDVKEARRRRARSGVVKSAVEHGILMSECTLDEMVSA